MSFEQNRKYKTLIIDKKNQWNKLSRISRGVLLSFLVLFSLGMIVAGMTTLYVVQAIHDAEEIDPLGIYDQLGKNSFIYDREGNQMEVFGQGEQRIIVEIEEMPEILQRAFIAVEDERFYEHNGLDYRRIIGAAWRNLSTGSKQGGSTITQQLAKNVYLSNEQTYARKIQDAYYAWKIEDALTKEEIFEAYLNTINLGGQNHGVEMASRTYFSKPVNQLEFVEAAILAGITQHPSRYSPIRYLPEEDVLEDHIVYDDSGEYVIIFDERVIPRYRLVLYRMLESGFITEEEYERGLNESDELHQWIRPNRWDEPDIHTHFADFVKDEVIKALVDEGFTIDEAIEALYSGGLHIYSTLDLEVQQIMEEEFHRSENFPDSLRDEEGNLLRDEQGNVQPQGAMVISDPQSGEVLGFLGGRKTTGRKIFNRAIGEGRPPGSSIKPLAAFLPALNENHTPASVIDDLPIYYDFHNPDRRHPTNVGNTGYFGLINLREALSVSSNVSATLLLDELSPTMEGSVNVMRSYLNAFGITLDDYNYSSVLGTGNVYPYDMTRAYNVIANKGLYQDLLVFTKIEDSYGEEIITVEQEPRSVVSEGAAYLMTDMMKYAVTPGNQGFGWQSIIRPGNKGIPVAGKTGTSQDQRDLWFAGFTPYYSGSLWIGHDNNDSVGVSSGVAAELWSEIMKRIHDIKAYQDKEFDRPEEIIEMEVCRISGLLPTSLCERDPRGSQVVTELFIRGTQPRRVCDRHVAVRVNERTGRAARWFTFPFRVREEIYFVRPEPYNPEEHDGIKPRDYEYQLPEHLN